MQFQTLVDLAPYNTFKVSAQAYVFGALSSVTDVTDLGTKLTELGRPVLFIGEGANILLTKDFPGLVVKNEIKGQKVLSDDAQSTTIEMGAGENWHDFVMWAVENDLSGIENLAYIPGTVGAAPVQNLAAYGQNVGEVIQDVKGYFLSDLSNLNSLSNQECQFFYRDSIFKHNLKDKFLITSVVFKLAKTAHFDTSYYGSKPYESLQVELDKISRPPYTPKIVATAVINQRKIKMPDWQAFGTAGSFFANPFVSKSRFEELKKEIPDLQEYPVNKMLYPNPDDPVFKMADQVKIPAGKLLDILGWRGKRIGNVGTFERHALIIVAYNGATGPEILEFSQKMQEDVRKNFGIDLTPEVNII